MCGLVGIHGLNIKDIKSLSYYCMLGVQHRGQEAAGLTYTINTNKNNIERNISNIYKVEGSVERLFRKVEIEDKGLITVIGHTRYSTKGSNSINNIHPFIINSVKGNISLAHNGNLTNTEKLNNLCSLYNLNRKGNTDTELIINLINYYWNSKKYNLTIEESIIKVVKLCKGSLNLIISNNNCMYVYRDPSGNRPLVEGTYIDENNNSCFIITSESSGLDIINGVYNCNIELGTLYKYSNNTKTLIYKSEVKERRCIFENIYFSRPDSIVDEKALYEYRYLLGEQLAFKDKVKADYVIGVPDSGLAAAIGYSTVTNIAYIDGFIKNRYIGRTFIQPTQKMRQEGIKIKLNIIPNILKNKDVIVIDDSIVRGNTSKILVENLRKAGVNKIHMKLTSPPIKYSCNLGMDFPSTEELIASTKTIKEIQDYINVDSLSYLTVEEIIQVTKSKDPDKFCTGCFDQKYLD